MKQFFRFAAVMLLAVLTSAQVSAQRQKPTLTFTDFAVDTDLYIYNVGADGFIYWGEAWTTQACIAETGFKYQVKNDGLDEGIYQLVNTDDNMTKSNKYLFRTNTDSKIGSGVKGCFVDGAAGNGVKSHWEIKSIGDKTYTISIPSSYTDETAAGGTGYAYVEGEVLGYYPEHAGMVSPTTGIYWDVVYAEHTEGCQWKFVSADDYATYAAALELYNAAEELKALCDEAAGKGLDVTEELAVYNNANATAEEIAAAKASVKAKLYTVVDPENPITDFGLNTECATNTGWISTNSAQNNLTMKSSANSGEAPTIGTDYSDFPFVECWAPNADKLVGKVYQVARDLPEGAYIAELSVFVNTFADDNASKMIQYAFANDVKTPLTTTVMTPYKMVVDLAGVDTMAIGFEQTEAVANWIGVDNCKLTYYGSSLASYQYLSKVLSNDWEKEFEDRYYNQEVYDAVGTAVAAAESTTTKEEALAAYKNIEDALAALRLNCSLYDKLMAMFSQDYSDAGDIMSEAYDKGYSNSDEYMEVLEEANTVIEEFNYNNEQLEDLINRIETLKKKAVDEALTVGADYTSAYIKNYNFNENAEITGWSYTGGKPSAYSANSGVAEVWNNTFNLWQDLSLPEGAWKLTVRGFYRTSSDGNYWQAWTDNNGENTGNNEVKAKLYVGSMEAPFVNVVANPYTTEQKDAMTNASNFISNGVEFNGYAAGELWIPNGVASANEVFKDATYGPNYDTSLNFLAVKDKDTRIGIKASDILAGGWTIFDEFNLVYLGTDASVVAPILADAVTQAQALAEKPMCADSLNALKAAIDAANNADTNNGAELFQAYKALDAAITPAQNSADTYQALVDAQTNLANAITQYDGTATEDAKSAANSLYSEVTNVIANGSIADADVEAKVAEINAAIKALKVPDTSKGEYPYDFTFAIDNADNTNGLTGWSYLTTSEPGDYNVTVNPTAEQWDGQGYIEGWNSSFDIWQDLTGLPEGLYKLTLQGFQRYAIGGAIAPEYDLSAVPADSLTKLYANGDTATLRGILDVPSASITDRQLLQDNNGGTGAWTSIVDTTDINNPITYYYPNNRQACSYRFSHQVHLDDDEATETDEPWYLNEVYFYVDATGEARIGYCNHNAPANGWSPASNWKLYYYGKDTDPEKQSATGINELGTDVVVKEVYNIDGVRTNKLNKGVNIVKAQTADGKQIVKKVVVK